MSRQRILVLLGPPGAGKGTQARGLAEKYSLLHLSTGEALRDAVRRGTEVGQKARAIMESGELVPDEMVSQIVRERVEDGQDYLLDGYPRNTIQAESLEEMAKQSQLSAIAIALDQDTVQKRLSGRRQCSGCGKIYNIHFSPSQEGNVCDVCSSGLIQRKDDDPEVIAERLRVYRDETAPIIDFYKERGTYAEVDGNREPEAVLDEIVSILDKQWADAAAE